MRLTRTRQREEYGGVPEEDLQQWRNVAEDFDINGCQLADHPVRRQASDTNDKAQQGRQDNTDNRHQQGIQQADDEYAGITVRFAVVDQVLSNTETGTVFKKAETRGNTTVLQVGLGIVEDEPAQRDHRYDSDDLK